MSALKLGVVVAVGSMLGVLGALVAHDVLDHYAGVYLQRKAQEQARKSAWEDADAIERTVKALNETAGKPGNWVPRLFVRRSDAGASVCGHLTFEAFTVRVIHLPGSAVRIEPYRKWDREFERAWLDRCA